MPDTQTQTPDLGQFNFAGSSQPAPTPNPQPPNPNAALGAGLGTSPIEFGDVMKQVAPYFGSSAPLGLVEKEAKLEGDVLLAQQKQKVAKAEAENEAYKKYGATATQALQSYNAEMADQPLPAFVPTKDTASDISMLGGLLAVVGFMVGKGKGMEPGLAAIDSMTGMLRGWSQGRKDLYDKELTTFKTNFERLRAAHQQYIQELQNALVVAKVDLTKGLSDAALAAAKAGDPIVAAQAKAGNLKLVIAAINGQQGAMLKAGEIAAKLYQTEAANLPLDQTTLDYWVKRMRAGDPMPALGFGGSNTRKALLRGVAEDAAKTGSTANIDQANSQIRKANETALAQIARTRALIDNYEKTAMKSSYLVEHLAQKGVGPTGTPIFDKWVQAGRRATGDPDVTAFNNSIETLVNEYAKVMSGGYGAAATAEGAINRAHVLLSESSNMKQLHAAVNVMRTEMEFRSKSLVDEQAEIQRELQNPGAIFQPSNSPPSNIYQSPDDVKNAYTSGSITLKDATKILKDKFGYSD